MLDIIKMPHCCLYSVLGNGLFLSERKSKIQPVASQMMNMSETWLNFSDADWIWKDVLRGKKQINKSLPFLLN